LTARNIILYCRVVKEGILSTPRQGLSGLDYVSAGFTSIWQV